MHHFTPLKLYEQLPACCSTVQALALSSGDQEFDPQWCRSHLWPGDQESTTDFALSGRVGWLSLSPITQRNVGQYGPLLVSLASAFNSKHVELPNDVALAAFCAVGESWLVGGTEHY